MNEAWLALALAAGLVLAVRGQAVAQKQKWNPPATAAPYLDAMSQAEQRHGLPSGLLARVAYQESRFRDDIITGKTVSSAGAIGLMQIVPRWHPDVNPYDPFASIEYAARYLASLHKTFGTWEMALAGYNWGQGNLSRNGFSAAPLETRNYVAQISADMGWAA